jgi:hypothetical protein
MPSLSTHEDASSQFAKREKIAAPLVKAIGTFFAVAGPRTPRQIKSQIFARQKQQRKLQGPAKRA